MTLTIHPVLTGVRLTLRQPAGADIDRLVQLAGDFEVARMLERMPHPYARADGEAWIAGIGRDPRRIEFAVDDGGGLVGALSLRGLDETPVIGYWLGRPYWGRGYMSEAAGIALAWVFEVCNAQAVEASVMTENSGSRKVLAKLGFRDIGETDCASLACGESRPARRLRLERDTFQHPGQANSRVQA
jgi:RimJ/RimL family protein N-acetyltransferase